MPQSKAQVKRKRIRRTSLSVRQLGYSRIRGGLWDAKRVDGGDVRKVSGIDVAGIATLPDCVTGVCERVASVTGVVYVTFTTWKTLKATGNGKRRIADVLQSLASILGYDYHVMRATNPTNGRSLCPDRISPWCYRAPTRGDVQLGRVKKLVADNADVLALSERPLV